MMRKMTFFLLLLVVLHEASHAYPVTPQIPYTTTYHTTEVIDPFTWLEDEKDPEVISWVDAQHAFTQEYFQKDSKKEVICDRLKRLILASQSGSYVVGDDERLITHHQGLQDEQPVYYLQENEEEEPVEILNPNLWGKGHCVEFLEPSPDGTYLLFGMSCGGSEAPVIYIMDLCTFEILDEPLCGWRQENVAWRTTSEGFFYSALPTPGNYFWECVFYHKIGQPSSEDEKVLLDTVHKDWFTTDIEVDEETVRIYRYRFDCDGKKMCQLFALDLSDGELSPSLIETHTFSLYNEEKEIGDARYLLTNWDANNGEIFKINDEGEAIPFIPENEGVLQDLRGMGGNLAVTYLWNAHTVIHIYDIEGDFIQKVPLPGIGIAELFSRWETTTAYLLYSSLTQPKTGYNYRLEDNSLTFQTNELEGKFNYEKYITRQVWIRSRDGTPVPMFLAHKRNLEGNAPTLLTGYGGFHLSILPEFNPKYVPWLEAGGIVAIPSLRGGGEFGEQWHQQGMREHKQNVFDDFIAAAEWLIAKELTSSEQLVIEGASNGGLLVGAAMTQRPELFRGVACGVPLLDMLRYHQFKIGGIWIGEYGCADDPEQFEFLYKYSPYHNISPSIKYPAALFYSGKNDFRVDPFHIRKMVAKLQMVCPEEHPILMHISPHRGHRAASMLDRCDLYATSHAFLMEQVGMEPCLPHKVPQAPGTTLEQAKKQQRLRTCCKIAKRRQRQSHHT